VKALTEQPQPAERTKPYQRLENALGTLRYPIIVIPIFTAILLAYYNKFRPANKWILLRGSAEAIKREIYRYRSRTGDYGEGRLTTNSRDDVFHERLEPISRRLMQTDVNHGGLEPYKGQLPPAMEGAQKSSWYRFLIFRRPPPPKKEVAQKNDDGFSFLTAERYIELRLEDQLKYYSGKTPKLEKQIKQMQVAILVAGGTGTLLAALHAELWVALTTSLATALTTWLASHQLDETLVRYNQSATDLANVRDWWAKLSPAAKRNPKNIDQLVEVTEKVLETELSGWVQRMENALAQLKAEEEKEQAEQEKGEQSGGDKSQPNNEGTSPPPEPDSIPAKAESEKGDESGGDKSQPKNEDTPPPPEPDPISPKEPANSPGQQDILSPGHPHSSTPAVSASEGL
jgi:hypothetical protein